MKSSEIKTALLYYYGFKRGMYVCTELSYYGGSADVFCISKELKVNEAIEIEVKISKSDLMNEFKHDDKHRTKHNKYWMFENAQESLECYPNKFYICVPSELCETVKDLLILHNRPYVGILEYKPKWVAYSTGTQLVLEESISVYKKAKRIYKIVTDETYHYFSNLMLNRMRNDLIGFYKEKYFETNRYKPIKEKYETNEM